MTLDEAIRHEEEVARQYTEGATRFDGRYALTRESCLRCAEDRRQIAEWLKELKERRAKDEPQRNMIEDIVESFGFKAESYRQAKAKTEPQIEPNLILPERMERGDMYQVGETIVVMNLDDYLDLICQERSDDGK